MGLVKLIQLSGPLALQELLAGNGRFVGGSPRHPDQTHFDREFLATSQAPSAVVVGCSDSRVPPSVIFDQGLGFIFEVRTAGHLLDDVAIASVEYAVATLGTQLVLVLAFMVFGAVLVLTKGYTGLWLGGLMGGGGGKRWGGGRSGGGGAHGRW